MSEYRTEHDSMGEVQVPVDALWGAQTQRSVNNFHIGDEIMPLEVIKALIEIKKSYAKVNFKGSAKETAIVNSCDVILNDFDKYSSSFPLRVWQTGSGTQSNMNVNEVISRVHNIKGEEVTLHPNDDVNKGQSTNDVFPAAIHVATLVGVSERLLPSIEKLILSFKKIEEENNDVIKSGRTHLQDATPIRFSQEVSAWRRSLENTYELLSNSLERVKVLPVGGTAVGTGINCLKGADVLVSKEISDITGHEFVASDNKFHSLSFKDDLLYCHSIIKTLSCNLFKIANDIRFLACGPRTGVGEIIIPSNEPGSSIMPGKVNPTQCEAMIMVCMQVQGNDVTMTNAASAGMLELNVCMPVIAYNMMQSIRLLSDMIENFNDRCVKGIVVNREKMHENLSNSLMNATILNPVIGYENVAKVVKNAHAKNITLKESCVELGYLSSEDFDKYYDMRKMV